MLKPKPPVAITMICPVIGRPSEPVTVPLTRVARIGFRAMTMSLSCWPTASVIRCAWAGFSVPGKYIGAYAVLSSLLGLVERQVALK